MQLVLATLENRPYIYKMIRFDSADPATRQVVETVVVSSLEDAESIAGADWIAGKAAGVKCREFQVGDITEYENGRISIFVGNKTRIAFESNEYTGTLPNITVDQTVLDSIVYKPNQVRVQYIVDGEMTLWQ